MTFIPVTRAIYPAAFDTNDPDFTKLVKRCLRCMEAYPLSEYHEDGGKADGYDVYCKHCRHDIRNGARISATGDHRRCKSCLLHFPATEYEFPMLSSGALSHTCHACTAPDNHDYNRPANVAMRMIRDARHREAQRGLQPSSFHKIMASMVYDIEYGPWSPEFSKARAHIAKASPTTNVIRKFLYTPSISRLPTSKGKYIDTGQKFRFTIEPIGLNKMRQSAAAKLRLTREASVAEVRGVYPGSKEAHDPRFTDDPIVYRKDYIVMGGQVAYIPTHIKEGL